ncbi:hypothetical protein C8J56DRAFT_939740, partial [Mycena floridula]
MIVYRIVQVGRMSSTGERSGIRAYRGLIEVLVESSALYAIGTMFALISYIKSGPASEFASAFWTATTGIAPTLLVARVASGESRPDDTWADSKHTLSRLSRLHFSARTVTTEVPQSYEVHADSSLPIPKGYKDNETVREKTPQSSV